MLIFILTMGILTTCHIEHCISKVLHFFYQLDQEDPICGCSFLRGPHGTLLSPGYPRSLPQINCTWRIEVNPYQVRQVKHQHWYDMIWYTLNGCNIMVTLTRSECVDIVFQIIVFSFREFVLGDKHNCRSAVMWYYDGISGRMRPEAFCGSKLPNITRSSGSTVEFELYFPSKHSWSGFRIDYAAVHNLSDSQYPVIGAGNIEGMNISVFCLSCPCTF